MTPNLPKAGKADEPCAHHNFHSDVKIARMEDTGRFMADLTIKCLDCDKPFQFLGLQPGLNMDGATVSIDALELRVGIVPQGTVPAPIHLIGFGIKGAA